MKNKLPKITVRHIKNLTNRDKLIEYTNKLFSMSKDPKHFAFSAAIGIFIGLFIPMGLQTILIVPVSIIFGCNLFIAWIFTLISNPITVIPIYLLAFRVGEVITHLEISQDKIERLISDVGYSNLLAIGRDGFLIFISGAFTTAIVSAFAAYILSFYLIKFYHKKKLNQNSL